MIGIFDVDCGYWLLTFSTLDNKKHCRGNSKMNSVQFAVGCQS